MKKLMTILAAAAIATSGMALAQSTDSSAQDTGKTNRPTAREAMEAEMQLQRNKPSKTVTEQDKEIPKYRPSSKDTMQAQMDLQKNKPSRPVDTSAKAPPRPNVSKMTTAEREELRKEVSKEAKP